MGNIEYRLQLSKGPLKGEVSVTIRTPSERIPIEDVAFYDGERLAR
jgi:hypothetical protein